MLVRNSCSTTLSTGDGCTLVGVDFVISLSALHGSLKWTPIDIISVIVSRKILTCASGLKWGLTSS